MKNKKRITLMILFLLVLTFVAIKPQYSKENPWLAKDGKPLVIAHAGGKGVFPSNTMSAFEYSYSVGVDVLEMDLQMTLDKILVLRHGENQTGNIRKMSNCDDVIWKQNYDYLYDNCNFGYHFKAEDGSFPYKYLTKDEWVAEGVYLTKLEELFEKYGKTILYNIEIKADADAWREETAIELNKLIDKYDLYDYVLVATSFHDISTFIVENYPEIQLSTSHDEAQEMIIKSYTQTNIFYTPDSYTSLQIPLSFNVPVINELNLSNRFLIWNAHRHNMAVHYWTINDEDVMRKLIDIGCDGIITDYPELLIDIINE